MIKKVSGILNNRTFQILIALIIGFVCYANTLNNTFAWDDRTFLFNWPSIKSSESGLPAYLTLPELLMGELPPEHQGVFRPIRSVFYLVSFNFFGENPLGYHTQALVVHILITLVVYLITEIITGKKWPAFATSALFAAHPIHTEAVSFITASFDTIGILFFFLSFYFYLAFQKIRPLSNTYLIASLLYGAVAFFTYELTLVLPILIVFYDFCLSKYSFKKLTPHFHVYKYYFYLLVIYSLIRFLILGIGDRSSLGPGFIVAANQARVGMGEIFIYYLSLLLWPVNLSIAHPLPDAVLGKFIQLFSFLDPSGTLLNLLTLVAFLFPLLYVFLFLLIAFLILRKFPLLFFAVSWIFISLLPAANILPQGAIIGLRFLYIPSYGFILLIGLILALAFNYLKKLPPPYRYLKLLTLLLFCALLSFYTFLTINRNKDWLNEETLWKSTIKSSPRDTRAYVALSKIYAKSGDFTQSEYYLEEAIKVSPKDAKLYSELGIVYAIKNDLTRAEEFQKKALEVNPDYYLANYNLGTIYLTRKKFEQAEASFQLVLKSDPYNHETFKQLGNLYYDQQKFSAAIENYQKSLSINSLMPETEYRLGLSYAKISDFKKAEQAYLRAVELKPVYDLPYLELARIYQTQNDKNRAIKILQLGFSETRSQILENGLNLLIK